MGWIQRRNSVLKMKEVKNEVNSISVFGIVLLNQRNIDEDLKVAQMEGFEIPSNLPTMGLQLEKVDKIHEVELKLGQPL